jgi:hypothetical protein
MSGKKRKLLIALLVLSAGATLACNQDKKPAPQPAPQPVHRPTYTPPAVADVKDTPIIIADIASAPGISFFHPSGASWKPDDTGKIFTVTLASSNWLIADGAYEVLDPAVSFKIGSQTVAFNPASSSTSPPTPPTLTVTAASAGDCSIYTSTLLHCNTSAIYGSSLTLANKDQHYPVGDPGHEHFLFFAQ